MGLDMYLEAKMNTYRNWDNPDDKTGLNAKLWALGEAEGIVNPVNIDAASVEFEVGYWRKANHIHSWFVNNVADGEDNCEKIEVSREQLLELKSVCEQVIQRCPLMEGIVVNGFTSENGGTFEPNLQDGMIMENAELAEELLPTQEGFFFGSCNYDQWYHRNLVSTVEFINNCLKLSEDWEFYYHASW